MPNHDHIRLYLAFRKHPLYPTNDREFTQFEAWMDLLAEVHPEGKIVLKANHYADKWGWMTSQVFRFFERLVDLKLITKDQNGEDYQVHKHKAWYDEEPAVDPKIAEDIIIIFNQIMGKKISLSPHRKEMITARIREGKKMNPPTGIEQFAAVFNHMKKLWSPDEKMCQYLQIETLCAKSHFYKYLDMAREAHRKNDRPKNVDDKAFTT